MTEDISSAQDPQALKPNPALKALDIRVGVWDLKGRDFTTKENQWAIHIRMDGRRLLPCSSVQLGLCRTEVHGY